MKSAWALALIAILVFAVSLPVYVRYSIESEASGEEFFFGVTYGSNTTREAKILIDKVKGYTNLFIVDSWDISTNETALKSRKENKNHFTPISKQPSAQLLVDCCFG